VLAVAGIAGFRAELADSTTTDDANAIRELTV
jgi:hypothetical protein